jgi:DtxR family transcriptional regulator, Mn-dependent transcriptional regulator
MALQHDMVTQEYIEIIALLEKENRVARVKDIACKRGVTRSSVSIALNQLAKKSLITHESYSHVTLTPLGRKLAQQLDIRHQTVKAFLTSVLGLPEAVAEHDACKFEHLISTETLTALTKFLTFIENCPKGVSDVIKTAQKCGRKKAETLDCAQCPVA